MESAPATFAAIIIFAAPIALLAALVWWAVNIFRARPVRYCTTCGTEGRPVLKTPGSLAIEIVLWFCFIVPGLIYSIWRLAGRGPACRSCGGTTLVPPTSPAALHAKKTFEV